mgnify:CR=1 FL=1
MQRKRNLHTLLVGLQIGAATMETSMEIPQKTKNWVTIWSSNPTTRYLPHRLKNIYPKRYMHTDVHSSIIHGDQDMEATKVPYNRWLDKEAVVHIYNGILLSYRKRWNTAISTIWMDLEIIMLSKISQTKKLKTMWYHLRVGYKSKSNKQIWQTNRDSWTCTVNW